MDCSISLLLCLMATSAMFAHIKASTIKFDAFPSVLKANLTNSLAMRCSLADTGANNGQIGKRGVTSTQDDVLHISSIIISRSNGQEVASVTPFDAPTAVLDLGNIEVKGDLSGTSSQGYLELSWKSPSTVALGEYTCEVNTIEKGHHVVTFTSTVELQRVAPTINDVIEEFTSTMQSQQLEINNLNHLLTAQKTTTEKQDLEINSLKTQLQIEHSKVDKLTNCTSPRVVFTAVLSPAKFTGTTYVVAAGKYVVFDKTITNDGGSYDTQTGSFVCPRSGEYSFRIHAISPPGSDVCLQLRVNSVTLTSMLAWNKNFEASGSTSAVLHLNQGDTVQVAVATGDCGSQATFFHRSDVYQGNVFSGHLLQSDECLA